MQLGLARSEIPFPGASDGQTSGIFGGPRPQAFIEAHRDLQRTVVAHMGAFGMAPVLQGWGGGVPDSFATHYPHAKLLARAGTVPGGAMAGGDVGDVLHPDDPLYGKIGSLFIKVRGLCLPCATPRAAFDHIGNYRGYS